MLLCTFLKILLTYLKLNSWNNHFTKNIVHVIKRRLYTLDRNTKMTNESEKIIRIANIFRLTC